MKGSGIYFSDSATTSIKYTQPCARNGRRYLLVSQVLISLCFPSSTHLTSLPLSLQVVLGKVYNTTTKLSPTTTTPPEGHHSVHAVKRTATNKSFFGDDEYCVYDTAQQKLEYLVELQLNGDPKIEVKDSQGVVRKDVITDNEFDSSDSNIDTYVTG